MCNETEEGKNNGAEENKEHGDVNEDDEEDMRRMRRRITKMKNRTMNPRRIIIVIRGIVKMEMMIMKMIGRA